MKKTTIIKLFMIITLLNFLVNIDLSAAQDELSTVTIEGKILNQNNLPVSGIIVKAFQSKDMAVTNDSGEFSIKVASAITDQLTISDDSYKSKVIAVVNGRQPEEPIILESINLFDEDESYEVPYRTMKSKNSVLGIDYVTGNQLESYPSNSFYESLAGLLPGVTITTETSEPGSEEALVQIRGEQATVYIDGVIRDAEDLLPAEIERVEVIKDLAGRSMLGISGAAPILWITTKKGESYKQEVRFSVESGISMATAIPEYVDAYNYAILYNEALTNDGYNPYYTDAEIQAYKNNTDPVHYPNIDYINDYFKSSTSYRRAHVSFAGGDDKVNYYSMIGYNGSDGLEAVGESKKYNSIKLRGNVNIKLNDYLKMSVNLTGSYSATRSPYSDIFYLIANTPSNAHPIYYDSMLIISNEYPSNVENSLKYGGFRENAYLSSENDASLFADLSGITQGLKAQLNVSFDGYSNVSDYEYETAALYRIINSSTGADSLQLMIPESIADRKPLGSTSSIMKKTVFRGNLSYDRTFDKHLVFADLAYYQGIFDQNNSYAGYQPEKMQDISLRAGYTYNEKYAVQLEQVVSGSMRLPKGSRFSYYPTVALGWVISNEDFMKNIDAINYLKLNASYGIIGQNSFTLVGYNAYYLYQTLWERNTDETWTSGVVGKNGETSIVYQIIQAGSDNYVLPKKRYINVGVQSSLFDNSLAVEINYYRRNNYDLITQKANLIPSLYGVSFLPASNYGNILYYGFDGAVQYSKTIGDLTLSAGINALYQRGKVIEIDEIEALPDYRKSAGKNIDEFFVYHAEGLYQSQAEIDERNVKQPFGDVKPGDIIYTDYNNDGYVDEKDIYRSGAHTPRLYFGVNVSLAYKGLKLKLVGQGRTNGDIMMAGNSYVISEDGVTSLANTYFSSTGTQQNFSTAMLNRWPVSNDFPRVTTSSVNNMQQSTFWLRDGTYFRLKNIELSYAIPTKTTEKWNMSNLTVFVRGSNVMEFSGLSKYGLDPEDMWAGNLFYPIYRTFTLGVTCKF